MALFADSGGGAVSADYLGVVGKLQEAGVNGAEDLGVVAPGEIGAADAAGEERISGEDHLERSKVERDRTLGVTGGVNDMGWEGW